MSSHHLTTSPPPAPSRRGSQPESGGRPILFRRAGPDDADCLVDLYEGLSEQSRYTRFGSATPRLTGQLRRAIADTGGGPVWVALVGHRCVGEARLVRSARSGDAHAAVTIADDHQHQGLGSRLVQLLLADPEADLDSIVVTMLADNASAVGLAIRFGLELRLAGGVLEGRRPRQGPGRVSGA